MKRLVRFFLLLTLLFLAGCASMEPQKSDEETAPNTTAGEIPETTADATIPETAAETSAETTAAAGEHVHAFTEKVQSKDYLKADAACGERPIYYYSCACGERGEKSFRGDPVPHVYGASVSNGGLIKSVWCTKDGCGHTETLNLQLPTVGTLRGAFNCTDDSYKNRDSAKILWYDGCEIADFESYSEWLQANGCRKVQNYRLGGNRYALFKGQKFTAYLSYLVGERAIRVYIGRSDDLIPSRVVPENPKTVAPAIWQIDVNCEAAKSNGGMSYVLQLPDGKFIVVDGGYDTKADADSIYKILTENKPESHEQPIVAAWFITHLHIDHVGTLRNFTTRYKNDVTVEGFYYNFPYVNVSDIWPTNNGAWEDLMASWEGATLYRKLHSGMQFVFAGAKVTVLCTFEDVYPLSFNSGNDTSTVFKIEIGGQSIVFLGDAEYGESDRMTFLPDDAVKADIMQYAHHGYDKQARSDLYQKINPTVILWPMTLVNWESESHGEVFRPRYETHSENAWARTAATVKKIIVMGEGTTKLELPYTPTGPRNADYRALYLEQKP